MSDESVKGYRTPGDVEILDVSFVTSNGNAVDISSLIHSVNVYQSIFRHYMECEITVHDSSKFLHNLPSYPNQDFTGGFSGTEIFIISYANRSLDKTDTVYTHTFRIYSVADRQSNNNTEVYLLSGISEEAFQTHGVPISKAYGGSKGNTTKNIIQSIFKEHFKSPNVQSVYTDLRKLTHNRVNKQLNVMDTVGMHNFVIPNLSVDDTIRFVSRESECPSNVSYFVFFEDSQNYNFASVNKLLEQKPIDEYWYTHTNVDPGKQATDKMRESKTIVGYRVNREFDLLSNLNKGLYKSKTIKLDVLKKKSSVSVYEYGKYAKKFNKLQKKIVQGVAGDKDPIINLMTTRKGHDSDSLFSAESPKVKRIEGMKDIKSSFRTAVFNTSMEVLIPANPDLKVGQVIKLNFPVDSQESEGQEVYDKYLSGNYLITKVRQIFTKTEMSTVLECTKDGGLA